MSTTRKTKLVATTCHSFLSKEMFATADFKDNHFHHSGVHVESSKASCLSMSVVAQRGTFLLASNGLMLQVRTLNHQEPHLQLPRQHCRSRGCSSLSLSQTHVHTNLHLHDHHLSVLSTLASATSSYSPNATSSSPQHGRCHLYSCHAKLNRLNPKP